ncbi:hypothetical protein, partial [Rhodobacter capsulatus]|uniref:hypothetical protein n=1 Tax=Rhodobacter capsulatus TaxID=1061 RepID=UPI001F3FEDB4
CASVKRLFLMSSAPSQVGQTLHHSEGTSGGQVTTAVHFEAVTTPFSIISNAVASNDKASS